MFGSFVEGEKSDQIKLEEREPKEMKPGGEASRILVPGMEALQRDTESPSRRTSDVSNHSIDSSKVLADLLGQEASGYRK